MDDRIRIGVLGELQVSCGSELVQLPPSKKTRALLAYLAVVGRPQRRERLCEVFWDVPDDPRGSLRWSLSKIRSLVNAGGERLAADRNTVFLRTEDIDLDIARLRELTAPGVEALGIEALEDAASLFRGAFLEDLELPRCPDFEAWRVSHGSELEVLRLALLRTLVARLRDDPQRALLHLNVLRTLDPHDAALAREAEEVAAAARRSVESLRAPREASPPREFRPVEATPRETAAADEGEPKRVPADEAKDIRFCATRDGVRIAYALSGRGPPLVRAAHWMSHLRFDRESPVWRHWIEGLSERNTLIRYDERGNGLSDWDVADFSFEAMVGDLESVADAAGLRRFTLLGVSQGCAISVAYAVRHPERVSGLVLYGGYVKGWRKRGNKNEIAVREALATLMREGWGQNNPIFRQLFTSQFLPGANAEQIAWFDELQRRTVSPENAWRLQDAFGDIDVSPLLSQVRVPTLVVHARHDSVAPFEFGRAFATGIPGARFVELESANHILMQDEPAFAELLQEIRAFADKVGHEEASALASAEQRRQISVLSAEIVSPLLAFEEADPELVMRAVDPLLDLAVDVVERHGGTVVSRGQNDVTGIFGAGEPTEAHALQACRAALAVVREVEATAEDAARVRGAVDTGEAIVRHRPLPTGPRLEVNGAPVRVARRLVQSLNRNLVAATERALAASSGAVHMDRLPASVCPAFPKDQHVYCVVTEKRARSRWHLRARADMTPLIGREPELQLLRLAAERVRGGSGQSVHVVAFPGMGKSRLVHEFLASPAADEFAVWECGALELDAQASYTLLKSLLRDAFGIEPDASAETAAARVSARLKALSADSGIESPLRFALDLPVPDPEWALLSAADRARRLRASVMTFVALEARRKPLVLLIEDLHWADPESRNVLAGLVDTIATDAVLLIATSRPEPGHDWLSGGGFLQLKLEGLPAPESESFLRKLLGEHPSVRSLARSIAEKAGGIPLFIEELVRDLDESGRLVGAPGRYVAPEEVESIAVPATVQNVIAARIGKLQDLDRRVLQAASVAGRDLRVAVLERLTGADPDDLDASLRRLQASGFLYEQHLVPARQVSIKHALIESVAYESILRERRKSLHARLVEVLEEEFGASLDEVLESLAEHALRAEDGPKAVGYLLRAARKALFRSAHNAALSYLRRGLEVLARWPETAERHRIELEYQKACGVAWMAARGWGAKEVSDAYERAEELCALLGDSSELFTVLRGRAQYYMISGQPEAAQRISTRCLAIAEGTQDEGVAIETHHMFWTNSFFMGDYNATEVHAESAVERYRPERDHGLTYQYSGHDPGVCCRCFSGLASWLRGKLDVSEARSRDAFALAERLSHPLSTALACWGLSYLHMLKGEPEPALAWAEREIAICDGYTLPLLRSQGTFQAGWAAAAVGDLAGGIRRMEEGVEAIRATGAEMGLPYFLGLLGEAHARAGNAAGALGRIEEALASARRNGARFQFSELLRIKAEVLAGTRDANPGEVEAILRSAIRSADRQGAAMPALRAAAGLARHLAACGRSAEARDVLRPYAAVIAHARDSLDGRAAAELL